MQPIERYGVIMLLLLVVTIASVFLWDQAEALPVTAHQRIAAEKVVAAKVAPAKQAAKARKPRAQEAKAPRAKQPEFRAQGWGPEKEAEKRELLAQLERATIKAEKRPAAALLSPKAKLVEPKRRTPAPQPAPVKVAEVKPRQATYVVQAGDTLGQIAVDQLGGFAHLSALLASNPQVSAKSMSVGTRLVLPAVDGARPTPKANTTSAPQPAKSGQGTYRVAAGDSLWRIAARELGDGSRWSEIAELNPQIKPSSLVLGDRLRLPGSASARRSKPVAVAAVRSSQPKRTAKRGVIR